DGGEQGVAVAAGGRGEHDAVDLGLHPLYGEQGGGLGVGAGDAEAAQVPGEACSVGEYGGAEAGHEVRCARGPVEQEAVQGGAGGVQGGDAVDEVVEEAWQRELLGGGPGERVGDLGGGGLQVPLGEGPQQGVLVREVPIQGADRHTGALSDLVGGGRGIAR